MELSPRMGYKRFSLRFSLKGSILIRKLIFAAAIAATVAAASGPGHAISGSGIVAKYNALRTANGFPAGIVEDADWSRKCALHNHYAAFNGNDSPNPHQETPGKPAYTADGDWAARNGLLAGSSVWYDAWKEELLPFATAPFHMAAILAPGVTRMGAADTEQHVCVGASGEPARARPATDTLYSYPGNGQSAEWAVNTGGEYPYSPNRLAGLPENIVTGPNIIVFWNGAASPLTRLISATLAGPSGPVAVKIVGRDQGSFVAPSSGFIIPVKPLAPGTSYQGTATFSNDSGTRLFKDLFSFSTTPYVPTSRLVRFESPAGVPQENKPFLNLVVHTGFPLQYAGASCTIRADYSNGNRVAPQRGGCATNPYSIPKAPAGGSVKITVNVAPFSVGDVKYPGATVSRVYAGPAVSTVVGRIGYASAYSYRRIAAAGFPVSVQLAQAGSRVGILLRDGKAIYGSSQLVSAKAAGRVVLRVHVSPAVGSLVQRKGRATLTLDVRVYPRGQASVDVLKRVTFTR
jgi:hypothetical protein